MNKQLTDEQIQEFEDKLRYAEEQNLVIEIGLVNKLPNLQEQNGKIQRRSKMTRTRTINATNVKSSYFIKKD